MESTSPTYSVIIPTFNRAALIMRAINSVQQQTALDWELIVVDDGSTDDTEQLMRSLSSQDGRIKYEKLEQNQGVSVARNAGIDLAIGETISFLDSDDEWAPNKLVEQARFMHDHPNIAGSITGVTWYEVDEVRITRPPLLSPSAMTEAIISRRLTAFGAGSCLMARTSVLNEHGIRFEEDWSSFEDWDFTAQIALAGRMGVVDSVLVKAHREDAGVSHGWSPTNVISTAPLLLRKYSSEFQGLARAKIQARVAVSYEKLGDYRGARRYWRLAWVNAPTRFGFLRRYMTARLKSI